MKNIKRYSTVAEYNADKTREFPCVSWVNESGEVKYEKDYSKEYLTFVALEDGTFQFNGSNATNTLDYSIDNGKTWVNLPKNTNTPLIASGSTILWKGDNTPNINGIGKFVSSNKFKVEGNILSILSGSSFLNSETAIVSPGYCYSYLFMQSQLVDAEYLFIPKNLMNSTIFQYMFAKCTSLTTAPSLPATTLTNNCYYAMFSGCTSLTTAPSLPATTLAQYCYASMFNGCTALVTAPVLSATTLAKNCYRYMFSNCTSLNSVTCLATNISASNCTTDWLSGVAANGTFIKDASMSNWTTGTSGIPDGWTVQNYVS